MDSVCLFDCSPQFEVHCNNYFAVTPELPRQFQAKEKNLTHGTTLNDGTDLRQVTVLTKNDWDRIQFQLNKRQIEQDKIRKAREEKERLHELSKEKVKNWSNTITVSILANKYTYYNKNLTYKYL